ncbi:MAG: ABC transporter permease subunit [Clostridia bacterium]|nr:ABC transporter permease subunit [Clostridia bacterium]
MKKTKIGVKKGFLPTVLGLLWLLGVWAVFYLFIGNEYLLPSPWACLCEAAKLLLSGGFYSAFLTTLGRAGLAALISASIAFPLAGAAFAWEWLARFLSPLIAVLRSLPTLAVLLLLLVFFGGNGGAICVAVTAALPMLYTAFFTSLSGADKQVLEMCKAYRVPVWKRVIGVYLPAALPKLTNECGAALSFALKVTVSAEILTTVFQSVGGLMQEARLAAQTATLMALTLLVCGVGLLLEWVFSAWARRLERRFL